MWGMLSAAERSILLALNEWRDVETDLTHLSYRAIMRYSGVSKMANISSAIKKLSRIHALQVSRGQRIGITRQCSAYRVTLDDPKFLEHCNGVFADARQEIAQEREYHASQKRERQRTSSRKVTGGLNTRTLRGTYGAPAPHPSSQNQVLETPPTYEGLNLSSSREVHANKALSSGKREIGVPPKLPPVKVWS
jgi:hypothetical protein